MERVREGTLLWTPPEELAAGSNLARYRAWLERELGLRFDTYDDLWGWSVADLEGFWTSIWEFCGVRAQTPARSVLSERTMPGTRWFDGATLNYAEHVLAEADARPAVQFRREDGRTVDLSRSELVHMVGAAARGLRRLGVRRGDRVAAYLPNAPEAVVAFLATASIGAIWSSCSPDFGLRAVTDRFRQIEPKVLLAVDGYRYGGRPFDRLPVVREIAAALPGLERLVLVPYLEDGPASAPSDAVSWEELLSEPADARPEPVPFDHPLWILFSSGTTGLPKAMVQGHGGILLEHLKILSLHLDLGPDDRLFWFTTTGWMMWNFIVTGLALGASIVLYDGSPAHPDLDVLWRLAEDTGMTYFGTSAPYLHACMKAGVEPREVADLSRLRSIGSTGAPLSPEGFDWVYRHVKPGVWLGSISGGTDLCTAFVGSNPMLPVHSGELQCRCLGARVEAYDADGRPVIDEVGELVLTEPMPSMPVFFWNDPDGSRYRSSYFETYPGVWRHGDWIKVTSRGTCVIYGRSDATLNRGGVRVGTSEFYRVVETIPWVRETLVVDTGALGREGELLLFVALDPDTTLDDGLRERIGSEIRTQLSPRHVPDRILQVPDIPKTLNGKRLEVPVKRLLMGARPEEVASPGALSDPTAFEAFVELARSLRAGR
ncbi:MAG TPA: acetoacetate--CoA ligase [Actinomycetota bacterium]|nr:acetoacetate--CoA ligase [Actinomycetota bacterium]